MSNISVIPVEASSVKKLGTCSLKVTLLSWDSSAKQLKSTNITVRISNFQDRATNITNNKKQSI